MICSLSKMFAKPGAVALGVAASLLASSLASSGALIAGQQQGKVEEKAVIKIEAKKDAFEPTKVEGKMVEKVEGKVIEKAVVKEVQKAAIKKAFVQAQPGVANDNLVKQFTRQYHVILEVELRILSASAVPTAEQRHEIALEGGKALKLAAVKMAEYQAGVNQGRANNMPDPRKMAAEAMDTAAKQKLDPDQYARYKKELDARDSARREAEVTHLVATLDRILILSRDQREKLFTILRDHWDEYNYPTIDTATMYDGYYPMINNLYLNPILDAEQKKIWLAATKISYGSIRNFNQVNNGLVVNRAGDPEDKDVRDAFAEELKK